MQFDLKKPCKDCPFIRGNSFEKSLGRTRVEQIANDTVLGDKTFQCHKTLDKNAQHCVGAIVMAEKINPGGNLSLRLAKLAGADFTKITADDVYDSVEEMLDAYSSND